MITRANIRRQLRASGGITNAVPRQQYGLGSFVKKAFKKVGNVAKQVVKSPLGKAALIGLGGYMLGPSIGSAFGKFGSSGLGGLLKGGFGKILGSGGVPQLGYKATGLKGLLGSIGKGKAALAGGAGLLSYFMSKGATEEEAQSLSADVNRGSGMGFDQIQRDIAAYRGGGQDESQMAAKGYRFLTPKRFTQPLATGGRVGLQEGTDPRMRGNPPVMQQIQPGDDMRENRIMNPDVEDIADYSLQDKDLEAGASSIKIEGDVRPPKMKMAEIPKDLSAEDAVRTFELSEGRKPKDMQEVIDFFNNRKLSAMGGIMDMPTGNMRRNKAGIKEIDYRATGGFVPVGIKEKADDVPAMLSKNEFVMTADAVRGAGNGSIKKGAQRMYDLMKQNESKVV